MMAILVNSLEDHCIHMYLPHDQTLPRDFPEEKGNIWLLVDAVRGTVSFLRWSYTGHISHTPRQAPCSGVVSNTNCNPWFGLFFNNLVWLFSFKNENMKLGR